MSPLHTLSAARLASLIRAREVSSREVVDAHLARIEETNGDLNAITAPLADAARAAADAADRTAPTGPLHGVPFTIKENIDVLGTPTTHGMRHLARALPYLDAPVVARMKAAGAIPIGRTNLSELGLRLETDNPLHGRTRHPWNRALTVGGSSGGDAVAVASGMTPLGLGNDMGGSLRVPAACCGVAALKPTTGRVPSASSLEPSDPGLAEQLMATTGPIARSVEDLALSLQVLAGRDIRDPRSVDAPLEGPPVELRAALVTELPGLSLPRETVAAIRRAGDLLEGAGFEVEEAAPPEIERACEVWLKIVAADLEVLRPIVRPVVSEALHWHTGRLIARADLRGSTPHRVHTERARLVRAWSGFLAEYPVLVGPSLGVRPWAPDADLDEDGLDLIWDATRFLLPGNALGLPSVTLPMGVVDGEESLPVSVQLYADLWREDLCLHAASIVERGAHASHPAL